MDYSYISPVTRKTVLDNLSQEDIFSYILKSDIDEECRYTAPYRADSNPGCYFWWNGDTLFFCDFANPLKTHFDCFQLYQKVFGIPYDILYRHIYEHVHPSSYGSMGIVSRKGSRSCRTVHGRARISIRERDFTMDDISYWKSYGITPEQLKRDKVKSVKAFMIQSRNKNYSSIVSKIGFAYTDFAENRKKIYQPYNREDKWFSNCSADDVGNIGNLPEEGCNLIITKSYKDCRVLRNLGYNCIWFQNEGMCPNTNILKSLAERFSYITVFYDNDSTGIEASKFISAKIGIYNVNSKTMWLPEKLLERKIKDSSDFVKEYGYTELNELIKTRL